MIQFGDAIFKAERAQLVPVCSKRIGFDDMSAGFEIGHVNTEDGLGARGIQFVHASLRPQGFVEQRSHRPVRDQHRIAQSLFKLFNLHGGVRTPKPPSYSGKDSSIQGSSTRLTSLYSKG